MLSCKEEMTILAIETSCDDTGVALLEALEEGVFSVLSNVVASQIELHAQYGGVFPAMAKREHQKNLVPVFEQALRESKLLAPRLSTLNPEQVKILSSILEREPELFAQCIPFIEKYDKPNVDAIAIVNGPGLEPCLWVGVNFARALSYIWGIPLIPVNHIESHILVNFLNPAPSTLAPNMMPALSLVVSGGHTQLILMKDIGSYEIIGETRDDAAGECFDKCAKLLDLGYPGGPIISKLAADYALSPTPSLGRSPTGEATLKLPRPMMNTNDYDFSFSGLKTAVLYKWREMNKKDLPALLRKALQAGMAHEVQDAIIDVLLKKTFAAAQAHQVKTIILGGGVSANAELRRQFSENANEKGLAIAIPPAHLSTDNALMSAVNGWFHRNKKASWETLEADANLRVGN